jgi:hypothetical protein
MMITRKALVAAWCVASAAIVAPVVASAAVGVDIDIAPPAPRVEVVPAERPGFVWAPGYWVWRGSAHEWVGGHWIRERRGFHWVPDRWVQVGPHWHYERGHWAR